MLVRHSQSRCSCEKRDKPVSAASEAYSEDALSVADVSGSSAAASDWLTYLSSGILVANPTVAAGHPCHILGSG